MKGKKNMKTGKIGKLLIVFLVLALVCCTIVVSSFAATSDITTYKSESFDDLNPTTTSYSASNISSYFAFGSDVRFYISNTRYGKGEFVTDGENKYVLVTYEDRAGASVPYAFFQTGTAPKVSSGTLTKSTEDISKYKYMMFEVDVMAPTGKFFSSANIDLQADYVNTSAATNGTWGTDATSNIVYFQNGSNGETYLKQNGVDNKKYIDPYKFTKIQVVVENVSTDDAASYQIKTHVYVDGEYWFTKDATNEKSQSSYYNSIPNAVFNEVRINFQSGQSTADPEQSLAIDNVAWKTVPRNSTTTIEELVGNYEAEPTIEYVSGGQTVIAKSSVANALALADEGTTVKLLSDVVIDKYKLTVTKDITLDLNGYTIDATINMARRDAGVFDVNAGKTFTLISSKLGGKIFSAATGGTADPVIVPREGSVINVIGRDAEGNNTIAFYGATFIRDYNVNCTVNVDGGEYYRLRNSDYGIIQLQKNFTCTVKNAFFYHNGTDALDGVFTFNGRFCIGGTTKSNATIDNCVIISNTNAVSNVYNNANVVITNSYISGDINPATYTGQTAGVITLGNGCAVNGTLADNVVLAGGVNMENVSNTLNVDAKYNTFTEENGKFTSSSLNLTTYPLTLEFDRYITQEGMTVPVIWKDTAGNVIATTEGLRGATITNVPYDQFLENGARYPYIEGWVDAVPDEWNEPLAIPADYEGEEYVITFKEGGALLPYKAIFQVSFNISAETNTKANVYIPAAPEGIEFTSAYIGDKLMFGVDEKGNSVEWEKDAYFEEDRYHVMSDYIGVAAAAKGEIKITLNLTCNGNNLSTTFTTDLAKYCNTVLSKPGYSEAAKDLVVNIANYLVSCVDFTKVEYTEVTDSLAEIIANNAERIVTPSESVLVLPDTSAISKYVYSIHIMIDKLGPSFVFTLTNEGKAAGVELSTTVGNAADESYSTVGFIRTGNDRTTNINRTTITVTPIGEAPVSFTYTLANYCKALQGTEGEEVVNALYGFVRTQMIYTNTADLSVEKSASHKESITANPGEEIEYSIKVTNYEETEQALVITDSVPANTTYVSGAETVSGNVLSWNVTVPAGKSATVTYKVKIDNDESLYNGGVIESTTASAGNVKATTNPIYIERTLNLADRKYIDIAIDALADSEFKDVTLAKWIYYVAYSNWAAFSDDTSADIEKILTTLVNGEEALKRVDKIVPTLYGGSLVSGQLEGVKGAPAAMVYESDLIVGDIILTMTGDDAKCYIYASDGLYLLDVGAEKVEADSVLYGLTSSDAYAVYRPISGFSYFTPTDMNATPDVLTDKQQVIVDTAKYYLQRGGWLQYDDTYFAQSGASFGNESRWEAGISTPEESTSQDTGYINCAAFTHDVYWTVFGKKLPSSMYTTAALTNSSNGNNMRMYSFTRTASQTHTEAEKEKVKNDFLNTLQPGDIMVILRGSSGHAMLYIGDGLFIHSTGSSYNYSGSYGVETYEPTIRYHRVNDYFFNEASTNGYVFGSVTSLCIVRPLNNSTWANYPVTENAQNRVDNLMGITAEKLPSVGKGVTVNRGDEITYTFSIRNDNNEAKTLEITDKIAANTVYVSGGDRVEGDTVYWTVTVPANAKIEVSYTIKVLEDTPYGTEIAAGDATVGGVIHKTYSTYVRRTLTAEEQDALVAAFNELNASGTTLRNLELVNELYKTVLGIENAFADTDFETVTEGAEGIFEKLTASNTSNGTGNLSNGKQGYQANVDGAYNDLVAPGLYGGRNLASKGNENIRTELAKSEHLVVGDVLIGRTSTATTAYLYLGGDYFINLNTLANDSVTVNARLERCPAYAYFYAVVRPTFVTEQ